MRVTSSCWAKQFSGLSKTTQLVKYNKKANWVTTQPIDQLVVQPTP